MPQNQKPKPYSLIHLLIIDAHTGEKIEFRFLPADVKIMKREQDERFSHWRIPVHGADSYIDRMEQIEGAPTRVEISATTAPPLTQITYGIAEANAEVK